MAKVGARNGLAARLAQSIRDGLKTAGIEAQVDTEPVKGTRLIRVFVVTDTFAKLRASERQDIVWRIIDRQFSPDEQLRVSMIYTATPDELPAD